jgi:hypothetical protein
MTDHPKGNGRSSLPSRLSNDTLYISESVFNTVNGRHGYSDRHRGNLTTPDGSIRAYQRLKSLRLPLEQTEGKTWLVNLNPLPYNRETKKIVFEHLYCPSLPWDFTDTRMRMRPITADEPIRSHLRRLYISIDAYFESNHPAMTFDRIAELVMAGPDGIRDLKRIRMKSLVKTYPGEARMLESPEWWNEIEGYDIEDIGDIFNYQYSIDWELPDEEDWRWSLKPVSIKREVLDEFKDALREELPERDLFQKADPREILLEQTSSTSMNGDFSKDPHWLIQGTAGCQFSNRPLEGIRMLLHTQTGSERDTVLLPIDQSNSVKLIDRQITQILSRMRGNGMFNDPHKLQQLLIKDREKYSFFINRDIKKEGLTKPRQLLHAIFEVLEEAYPDLELEKYRHIYDDYTIHVDGVEYSTERGHGLGMANALTTMMQLGVFYTIQGRMVSEGFNSWDDMTCKAYNDDFYAAFISEETSWLYGELELDVFEDLSLIPEPRKSIEGPFSILCENYSPPLNKKESYARREVLMALACTNIVQAKVYLSTLTRTVNPDLLDWYLPEIISYWGYEFDPDEKNQPLRLGGWTCSDYRGVSDDLNMIVECPRVYALYKAGRELTPGIPRGKITLKRETFYMSPLELMYEIDSLPDKKAEAVFNLGQVKDVGRNFVRLSMNPIDVFRSWENLRKRRKKIWRDTYWKVRTKADIEKKIIRREPLIDFIANETAYCYRENIIYNTFLPVELTWEHLITENPRIAYLQHSRPDLFRKEKIQLATPIPLLLGGRGVPNLDYRAQTLFRSRFLDIGFRESNLSKKAISKCMLDSSDPLFNMSYLNPRAVCAYAACFKSSLPVPSVIPQEKAELIKLVKPWMFTTEELKVLHFIPYHWRYCIRVVYEDIVEFEDEILNDIVPRIPFKGKHKKPRPTKVEKDDDAYYDENIEDEDDLDFIPASKIYVEVNDEFGNLDFSYDVLRRVSETTLTFMDARHQRALKLMRRLNVAEAISTMGSGMETAAEPIRAELRALLESLNIEMPLVHIYDEDSEGSEPGFDWDEFG